MTVADFDTHIMSAMAVPLNAGKIPFRRDIDACAEPSHAITILTVEKRRPVQHPSPFGLVARPERSPSIGTCHPTDFMAYFPKLEKPNAVVTTHTTSRLSRVRHGSH